MQEQHINLIKDALQKYGAKFDGEYITDRHGEQILHAEEVFNNTKGLVIDFNCIEYVKPEKESIEKFIDSFMNWYNK